MMRKYDIAKTFGCGYPKLDSNIEKAIKYGQDKNISNIIVTDLSLEMYQYERLEESFDNIIYIDHHGTSQPVFDYLNQPLNTSLCAGALCAKHINQPLSSEDKLLVGACNSYDLWKTTNKSFSLGYDLTVLFYESNLWKFIERFKDGYGGLTVNEIGRVNDHRKELDSLFEESAWEQVDDDLIFLCSDGKICNDVTLRFDVTGIYWMIKNTNDHVMMSIRTKRDDIDLGYEMVRMKELYPDIISDAGGHSKATGLTLKIDEIDSIIEFIHKMRSIIK